VSYLFTNGRPSLLETVWTKQENDTYIRQEVKRPLWGIVFHKSKDEIKASEEFAKFTEVIKAEKTISSHLNTLVGTCVGRSRFETDNIVYRPLSQFLTDTGIMAFDEQIFETEYLKIENGLFSTDIEFERITPLCGFSTDTPDLALGPNLSIVELSDSEITQLLNLGIKIGESFGPENFIHQIHKFAIKLTYSLPKIIGDEEIEGSIETHNSYIRGGLEQDVLNALRLYKEGQVFPITTISKSKSIFSMGVSYSHGTPTRSFMINKFQLIEDEKDIKYP